MALVAPGLQLPEFHQEPLEPEGSYCGRGKLLPELYVLGPMSTCTSSLWDDFKKVGFIAAPDNSYKEWNFFQQRAGMPADAMFEDWLSQLKPCPEEERVLMVDMSVSNIATVPSLPELRVAGDTGDSKKWDAAALMSRFHNDTAGKPPRLMVMLRDPLVRIHSEYYHMLEYRSIIAGHPVNSTFPADFAADVALLHKQPPVVSEWLWKSFTARGVEEYLKHFPAAQFMFVPIYEYIDDPANFSADLFARLGVEAEPWQKATHSGVHPRPAVDDELPPSSPVRADFEAFFAPEVDRLVQLLASAQTEGAWLAGYQGATGNQSQVRSWLLSKW